MSTAAPPRYPLVLVDVDPDSADETSALLFELGAQGVEERDQSTLLRGTPGKVTLVASFASHDEANEALAELDESLGGRLEEIVGDEWRDEWKKHFRPFDFCEGIVVRPPWEPYEETRGWQVLELEPGRAFGTGLHESTSLVARALVRHKARLAGAEVLDVGCGSGILSFVALLFGAKKARAIDIDAEAIEVVRENAARNGLEDRVEADTTDVAAIQATYPIVLANIERNVLVPLAKAISARVAKGGLLMLSGLLVPQKEEILAAYQGFSLESEETKGEWIGLVLVKG